MTLRHSLPWGWDIRRLGRTRKQRLTLGARLGVQGPQLRQICIGVCTFHVRITLAFMRFSRRCVVQKCFKTFKMLKTDAVFVC